MNLTTILAHAESVGVAALSDTELDRAIAAIEHYRPLFSDTPAGTSLYDAALAKFHRGDALAVEFMRSHTVPA